jgi:phosphatidylethanolamine-binding protein (PEBP) family uncharacterized protein
MAKKRISRLAKKRRQKRRKNNTRKRYIQRGGDAPLVGLLDNADGVPIANKQPIEFHVKFGPNNSQSANEFGSTLTVEQAQPEPHAYWTPPPANTLYTLVCWDPDAQEKSWLHWLVINCKKDTPTSGDLAVDWFPPSPPKGSGLHRYIFGIFQQAAPITAEMKSSGGFHMANFATQHQLTPLAYKGVRVNA